MRLVAFDLDDTLAPSKSALPESMANQLRALLDCVPVCVISGGEFGQFRTQLLDNLGASSSELKNLHLMPTCGTRYYRWDEQDAQWEQVYANDLTREQRERAIASLERHARQQGVWEAHPWGEIIEDRGSQITFSALGQQAPLEAKLVEITGIAPEDMLFIGDRLDEAGNDYPVKAAGYPTLAVSGWEECVDVIAGIVKELRAR